MGYGSESRFRNLDALRGIAILFVVLGHAIQANLLYQEYSLFWERIICCFQMPLLFFISGMSNAFSLPTQSSAKYVIKKTVRLLIPYLCWVSIHYFVVSLVTEEYREIGIRQFLKEIAISDFWFVRVLIIFSAIFALCNALSHFVNRHNQSVFLILIVVASGILLPFKRTDFMYLKSGYWYYLWFVGGYVVCYFAKGGLFTRFWNHIWIRNLIALFSVSAMLIVTVGIFIEISSSKITCVVFCVGIAYVIAWLDSILPLSCALFNKLASLGKISLPVYAIHWCLLFSPLWRIGFYQKYLSSIPLYMRALVTSILWLTICDIMISLLRKSKYSRVLLLGEK